MGPGHVLYVKSELTEGRWRIYSDNIAMARWLQKTVQGMLNPELKDLTIPVTDAAFEKSGDPRYFLDRAQTVSAIDLRGLALTWYDIGEPLLIHTQPNQAPNPRPLRRVHAAHPRARRTADHRRQGSRKATPWARDREGQAFLCTCALAFSESWTEPR